MAQGLRVIRQATGEGTVSQGGPQLLLGLSASGEIPSVSACKCASLANHKQAPPGEPACPLAALTGMPEYLSGSKGRIPALPGLPSCASQQAIPTHEHCRHNLLHSGCFLRSYEQEIIKVMQKELYPFEKRAQVIASATAVNSLGADRRPNAMTGRCTQLPPMRFPANAGHRDALG